ncbi:alpha/beta hydrolase [Alkalihalophilus marmarensis]|uniref:Alpha\beta hydrolase n=1 Tax=Alkalihalophilus marmarensis DSM 21297 TaxID=1188261 RepID=U6SSQ3_9BACI|nr:alpha/beta hydrolase [Alkalihalophilus marmarensis]ERN54367.1 alpha\beta hydrolase [Alkalihalophilus marmarensis DSM 21297]MCM3488258.1 alpha/beta hydrolase [Alkalihalophilus marmarensis]
MEKVDFVIIETNGIKLHTAIAGPEDGPLVILLHGFPEFWYGWRNQIDTLVKAGYRVVIPDQRGYNLSEKPLEIREYTIDHLRDTTGLIDYLGYKKANIIGHDWGGIVAWHLASTKPDYVEKLTVINSPHPAVFKSTIFKIPMQLLRSMYMMFFQIPKLPETLLSQSDYDSVKKVLRQTSLPDTFTDKDLSVYVNAWQQPNALTTMLNWYRAMTRTPLVKPSIIQIPVQVLWGQKDAFLSSQLAKDSAALCDDAELIMIDGTHWVHLEKSELVNSMIGKFLAK